MKLIRIVIILLMVCLSILAPMSPVFAEGGDGITLYVTDLFDDISASDWFAGSVQQAYTLNLMKGMSRTAFEPQISMTRAMFVQVLYSMEGSPALDTEELPFSDVRPEQWFYPAVCWAYTHRITSGISEDQFDPDFNVTREQAVQLLYAFSGSPEETGDLTGFMDTESVDSWAFQAVGWAVGAGLLSGSAENGALYLNPRSSLRRSEAARLLTSFYHYREGSPDESSVDFPQTMNISMSSIRKGVRVPVLMYHEVSDEIWGLDYLFVSPGDMRRQLEWLQNNGYDTIFFSDLTHLWDYDKPVMLTFDDGYEGNYTNLFPLLQEFNMKATIFVATDYIGEEYRLTVPQIREMSDSGLVSIQSHTKSHTRIDWMDREQLEEECRMSRAVISGITGKTPYVLSYPEGKYSRLSDTLVPEFFSFCLLDRGGTWRTGRVSMYRIPRTVVPRGMTLKQFAARVRQ